MCCHPPLWRCSQTRNFEKQPWVNAAQCAALSASCSRHRAKCSARTVLLSLSLISQTEALRLGDAFEATPQKDGKAEFPTQDSRTPRPTPLWGHSTTIQSFHHRPCARLPTGVVSVCVGNHAAQRCIRDHQGSAASGNPTASEPIPGYHPLWDFIRFPLPWAALCQLSNPLVVSQL